VDAARASQDGIAPIPANTTADPRKKMRRVNMSFLPPLKIG
jgi:hypothetical protein